jgi:ATP-dependent Clp protease protease subunit
MLQATPDSRILYLSGDVEDTNISQVCKDILNINDIDKKGLNKFKEYELLPIHLHVQSFGGSITDMWALIDIIESSITPIITHCSGYCMSAAALIFLAGHYRCMHKHSSIMFHQMFVGTFAKFMDFNLEQKQFDNMHKDFIKYIKKRTKLKKKFFHKMVDLKRDMYLNSKQCLKYGVCDEIEDDPTLHKEIRSQLKQLYAQQNQFGGFENV